VSERLITEWQPVSALREIEIDISGLGYSKEYIEKNHLSEKKSSHWINYITGQMCFYEFLELKVKTEKVYWRENDNISFREDIPEFFQTQFGHFNNHNNGEFESWLGKEACDGISAKGSEKRSFFEKEEYSIRGNFCDMFDCGEYSFAVSNLMHLGLGQFKIVRIDKTLTVSTPFTTDNADGWFALKYLGRFHNEKGYILLASGFIEIVPRLDKKREFKKRTVLFQIDTSGDCYISKEWEIEIPAACNYVYQRDHVFFGHNKMITRLDLESGDLKYLTNKNDEELEVLKNGKESCI
jgi:hypothetical protein